MRSLPLAIAALLLAPLTAASATAAVDWRAAACADEADEAAPIAGAHTVVSSQVSSISQLPGVKITSERLDFSGVTCELLHVSGELPAGAQVGASSYTYTTYVHLVVDGIDRGEVEAHQAFGGSTGLYSDEGAEEPGMPDPSNLLSAVAYRPVESGVMPTSASIPPDWQGKPYTATYVRSEWTATFGGRSLVSKAFDRTAATDRAARAASTKAIARSNSAYAARAAEIKGSAMSSSWKQDELEEAAATRSASIKLARKTLRLALRGQRLVKQRFNKTSSGSLLP